MDLIIKAYVSLTNTEILYIMLHLIKTPIFLYYLAGLLIKLVCSVFEYGYPVERHIADSEGAFKLNTNFRFLSPESANQSKRPQSASGTSSGEINQSAAIPDIDLSSELITKTPKVR